MMVMRSKGIRGIAFVLAFGFMVRYRLYGLWHLILAAGSASCLTYMEKSLLYKRLIEDMLPEMTLAGQEARLQ